MVTLVFGLPPATCPVRCLFVFKANCVYCNSIEPQDVVGGNQRETQLIVGLLNPRCQKMTDKGEMTNGCDLNWRSNVAQDCILPYRRFATGRAVPGEERSVRIEVANLRYSSLKSRATTPADRQFESHPLFGDSLTSGFN